jgi:DNA-binding transcriptional regulator GbsR (MarR family)
MIKAVFVAWVMTGTVLMAADQAPNPQVPANSRDREVLQLVRAAMESSLMIQNVVKGYLYAGNDVATTQAKREIAKSLKRFEEHQKSLQAAFTDPKVKNLMTFITMNLEEIKELLKEPYSLENAEVMIDLGEAVAEGERKIAGQLRKKLTGKYPVAKGQRYDVTQVAKYYMAYQAGIKDENTVRQMEKTVKKIESLIGEMKSFQGNTVKMNQTLNQIEKLWKVVKQFYLDIEEGGLPVIVYQTTRKLDGKFREYTKLLILSMPKS